MSSPSLSTPRGGRRAAGRRRDPRPAGPPRRPGLRPAPGHRAWVAIWAAVVLIGAALVGNDLLGVVSAPRLVGVGSVLISTAYVWGLAARTGGRPAVFGVLAAMLGVATLLLDAPVLRTGAAVMTVVAGAVLSVVATVPARNGWQASREAVVAVLVGTLGALAAVGYAPMIAPDRYSYMTLGMSLALVLVLVYRLGAGLHGLGRRGLLTVVVGSLALAVLVAYAELFERYGTADLVDRVNDGREWAQATLGGAPRPLQTLIGIPALVWGTHQRARRRQGWWTCAFGVIGTASIAALVAEVGMSAREFAITEAGSLAVGGLVGVVLIMADKTLTGGGRRSSRTDAHHAVRPEPARTRPLL